MKILCLVCELWLVELDVSGGMVSYWCMRCEHESRSAGQALLRRRQTGLHKGIEELLCNGIPPNTSS